MFFWSMSYTLIPYQANAASAVEPDSDQGCSAATGGRSWFYLPFFVADIATYFTMFICLYIYIYTYYILYYIIYIQHPYSMHMCIYVSLLLS